jgi:hypothetical protein
MSDRHRNAQSRGARLWQLAPAIVLAAGCSAAAPAVTPSVAAPTNSPAATSPAPLVSPTAATGAFVCEQETTGCSGRLSAGDHHTGSFDHPFTYTIAEAGHWSNVIDLARAYVFRVEEAPNAEFIVWSQAAPEAQMADCSAAREPDYGTSVSEWIRFLEETKRVKIVRSETFDLGAHRATRLELAPDPAFSGMCDFNTDPFSLLVTDTGNPPTRRHGGTPASMTLIDFGDDTLIVWNDGGDTTLEAMMELSLPVIRSIRFVAGS